MMSGGKVQDLPTVTLEVMNPRGALAPQAVLQPSARVRDLSGKKIGIYWTSKAGADNLLDVVAELLKERFHSAQIIRYDGPLDAGDQRAADLCREVDTIVYGVGD